MDQTYLAAGQRWAERRHTSRPSRKKSEPGLTAIRIPSPRKQALISPDTGTSSPFSRSRTWKRWSLIASDAFHNLRCALDHLVYAFAVFESKSNPPPGKTVLSFPICDDPKWFRGAKKKLEPLSACVREEIEFMQPYNRRHARLPPLLGLLRDFDDSDKHRLLHIAMAQAWQREFKDVDHSVVRKGEAIEFFYRTAEVVDGAEIAAIIYPRPSPDMNHKLLTTIVVSIGHRTSPLDRNRRVKTAINNIAAKA